MNSCVLYFSGVRACVCVAVRFFFRFFFVVGVAGLSSFFLYFFFFLFYFLFFLFVSPFSSFAVRPLKAAVECLPGMKIVFQ